jgi:hypothetical protein
MHHAEVFNEAAFMRLYTTSSRAFCRSATAIGQALHNNRILTYLDLSFNPLGDEGNQVIARALEDNTVCQDSN